MHELKPDADDNSTLAKIISNCDAYASVNGESIGSDDRLLPEPMMTYCRLDPQRQI